MEGDNIESLGERERQAMILHYASIASQELVETDSNQLEKIDEEKKGIEENLGMTSEEIIVEARKLVLSDGE